jgi:hypothetical protein
MVRCSNCQHLDKSKKQSYGQAYRYGCGLRLDGYTSTWINTDRLLSEIGCNNERSLIYEDEETDYTEEVRKEEVEEVRQMTIDEWLGV